MYIPGDSAFAARFARINERAEMKTQGATVSSTSFWFSETRAPLRSLPGREIRVPQLFAATGHKKCRVWQSSFAPPGQSKCLFCRLNVAVLMRLNRIDIA